MLRPLIFPSMVISSGSFPKIRMFLTRRLGSAPANPTKKTVHRLMYAKNERSLNHES